MVPKEHLMKKITERSVWISFWKIKSEWHVEFTKTMTELQLQYCCRRFNSDFCVLANPTNLTIFLASPWRYFHWNRQNSKKEENGIQLKIWGKHKLLSNFRLTYYNIQKASNKARSFYNQYREKDLLFDTAKMLKVFFSEKMKEWATIISKFNGYCLKNITSIIPWMYNWGGLTALF